MDHLIDLGPHAAFIWIAYAITGIVLAALIAWLIADGRSLQQRLDDLATRGITRRSEPSSEQRRP